MAALDFEPLVRPELLLSACPFCGSSARFGLVPEGYDDARGQYVECCNQRCGASSALVFACMDDPRPELAARWNRRA